MASSSSNSLVTLRSAGLGHTHTLEIQSTLTIAGLKEEIEVLTGIPTAYQRLLARGSNLKEDNATLSDVGLKDRTKVMLMHNQLYAQEKDGYEALTVLEQKLKELEEEETQDSPAAARAERVTNLCCKLDAVDTQGSENLRSLRKKLLQRAEQIDAPPDQPKKE